MHRLLNVPGGRVYCGWTVRSGLAEVYAGASDLMRAGALAVCSRHSNVEVP